MKTILHLISSPAILIAALFLSTPASSQQWTLANHFGGTAVGFSDAARAICTDAAGNVYATGNFNATINFGNGTSTLTATAGGTATDGFVAKFNSAGLCQWSMRFGGAATDLGGFGIVTDGATVFVTGQSQFPSTIGSTPLATVGGSTDGVVFALNASTGATMWATAFGGGSTNDMGQAICLDGSGKVYISGIFATRTTNPTAFFGAAAAFPRTVQGSMVQATSDLFVAQLNPASGAFNWVSSGGAASQAAPLIIGNDNVSGSGIAFIPTLNQLVVAGSFASANASYFSNGSPTPSVTLTNVGQTDICVLKLDLNGNFLNGFAAGGTSNEEALGITYDAGTAATYITGYYNSASIAGSINLANSSGGFDEIFYCKFDPSTNTFPWANHASGSANDQGLAIASSTGNIYVTGRFQNTISFPTATTPFTNLSSGADDIFLLKVNPANGNATELATGNGVTGTDAGLSVATAPGNNVWTGGIFAGTTVNFTPSSPPVSVTATLDQELFIAKYNDPPPTIGTQPLPSTACSGLAASFTVVATGSSLTYQWQESTDIGFSSPTNLTNTGIYSGTTTATLNISDNTTVNGRFYRVIITNPGGTVTSNGALLTATTPTLSANNTVTQTVNTSNNLYYATSCALIDKVVPSGASPVAGSVSSRVWVEGAVPTYTSEPFVQRHYQITPAVNPLTATAKVTLYFLQSEFDAFNAAPGSTLDLPANPTDNAGKANLRVSKYSGTSSDGSGLPGSYSSAVTVLDPPDANIVWNAIASRWEITVDVTGFSGFIVQTNQFVLPVNLISFSAQLSGNAVQLNWKTADELNNDHFELERSTDGRAFTSVGRSGALSGGGIKNYDWTDANITSLNTSKLLYRLKIVSVSGSADYSNTIIVFLDKSPKLITSILPNPFRGQLNINLNMPEAGNLVMKLSDMNGRIFLQENIRAPKGFSTQSVKGTENLAADIYFLSASYEGQSYNVKIIKER